MSTGVESRLRDVVAAVLGVRASAITETASPKSVAEWDSVGHLSLMLAVEAEFGVQFTPDDIANLTTFAAIRDRLLRDSA